MKGIRISKRVLTFLLSVCMVVEATYVPAYATERMSKEYSYSSEGNEYLESEATLDESEDEFDENGEGLENGDEEFKDSSDASDIELVGDEIIEEDGEEAVAEKTTEALEDTLEKSEEQEASTSDLKYEITADGVEITGYEATIAADVKIPSQIEGASVTSIRQKAFRGCSTIKSITLPNTIKGIGYQAFSNCTNLEKVVLPSMAPEMLKGDYNYIGEIFSGCTLLKTIEIKEGWKTIPDKMFVNSSIENVVLPNSLESIGNSSFSGCKSLKTIDFPENLKSIGNKAFTGCIGLTEIVFPDGLAGISYQAFNGCTNLESITLPATEPEMLKGDYNYTGEIFTGCTSLNDVEVPAGWTSMPDKMFVNSLIEKITFPNTLIAIGNSSFAGCKNLKDVTLPTGLETIGNKAFLGCSALLEIVIPEDVTGISYQAFSNCTNLTSVTLPANEPTMLKGDYNYVGEIFTGCTSLKNIVLPENWKDIPVKMFVNSSIEQITLPAALENISDSSFAGCKSIKKVVLPENLKTIGNKAFNGCIGLTEITFPDSLTGISYQAFTGCTNLASVTFAANAPEMLKGDFNYAGEIFTGCTSLTSINVPIGWEKIPEKIFANSSIVEVTLPSSLETVGNNSFANCKSLKAIVLPDSLKVIDSKAFLGCSALTEIVLPDGITGIGYQVFSNCTNLANVMLPANVPSMLKGEYNYTGEIFTGCTALKSVVLPEEWKDIPAKMFVNSSIEQITLPTQLEAIGDSSFAGCKSIKEVVLPESLKTIGNKAFSGCSNLEKIELPNSLTGISFQAFYGCANLESVTLPADAPEMLKGDYNSIGEIFSGCTSLKSVEMPDSWEFVPERMFYNSAIEAVKLSSNLKTIKSKAFYGCANLKEIVFPDSLTGIAHQAFGNCKSLAKVTLSKDAPEMLSGDFNFVGEIFNGCASLKSVEVPDTWGIIPIKMFSTSQIETITLPKNLKTISNSSFLDCKALKVIELPNSLETIGNKSFAGCSSLEEVEIPDSVGGITYQAFADCTSLKRVSLPAAAPEMLKGEYDFIGEVFSRCTSLKEIEFPDSWESIPEKMFTNSSFEEIVLPKELKTIYPYSFSGCKSLKAVTLPENLERLGYRAFYNCTDLEKIVLSLHEPELLKGEYNYIGKAFEGCISIKKIEIPDLWEKVPANMFAYSGIGQIVFGSNTKEIGNSSFEGCTAIREIRFPEDMKVGSKAFAKCTGLEKIYIDNDCTISDDAFNEVGSNPTVYIKKKAPCIAQFIENECSIVYQGDYQYPDPVLTIDDNIFTINRSRVSAGMSCQFTVNYSCDDEKFSEITKPTVVVYVPKSMNYVKDDIYLNGKKVAAGLCSYDAAKRRISIPISKQSGSIKISLVAQGSGNLGSYALLTYNQNGIDKKQIIDCIQVQVPSLSLECSEETATDSVYLWGITNASQNIKLYCNDTLIETLQANKLGEYSTTVHFPSEGTYKITATYADDASVSTSKYVRYQKENIELTQFMFYYRQHANTWLSKDLLTSRGKVILTINPNYETVFKVNFSDDSDISNVYVVSTKNGVKKYIKAVKGESGEYVASGYFDPKNHQYVPGQLSVKYTLKDFRTEEIESDYEIGIEEKQQSTIDFINEATGGGFDFNNATVSDQTTETYTNEDGTVVTKDHGVVSLNDDTKIGVDITKRQLTPEESRDFEKDLSSNRDKYIIGSYDGKQATIFVDYERDLIQYVVKTGIDCYEMTTTIFTWAGLASPECGVLSLAMTYSEAFMYYQYGNAERGNELLAIAIGGTVITLVGLAFPEAAFFLGLAYNLYTMNGHDYLIEAILDFLIDPSGYVYEAVEENRLEDVTVSIYFKKNYDDEEYELWGSSDYGQNNPLLTDRFGEYAWDVPEGFWQVKFEKEGYQTKYSEWMEVPPVRTEVNVGMVSTEMPKVENVYTDGAEITLTFSQYMNIDSISDISVTAGEEEYAYTVKESGLSKVATLILDESISESVSTINVTVPTSVKNYADNSIEEEYSTDVLVKKLPSFNPIEDTTIEFGKSATVEMSINNYSSDIGLELTCSDSIGLDATVEDIDENGKVTIAFVGNLPGEYSVVLKVKDTEISTTMYVNVGNITGVTQPEQHEHELVEVEKVAATCATSGIDSHFECILCRKLFTDISGENEVSQNQLLLEIDGNNHLDEDDDGYCDACEMKLYEQGLWVEDFNDSFIYTGKAIKPTLIVHNDKYVLDKSSCTITYKNNIKVYTLSEGDEGFNPSKAPSIKITGKGNYSGSEVVYFKILPSNLSTEAFVANDMIVKASSKPQKPVPKLIWNGKALAAKGNYSISYYKVEGDGEIIGEQLTEITDAGEYIIRLTGKGTNYVGTKDVKLLVTADKKLVSKLTIGTIKSQPYTGEAVTPKVVVKDGKTPLIEGTHYEVAFENNTEVGTATVIINGINEYIGSKKATFKISGKSISKAVVVGVPTSVTYTGKEIKFDDIRLYIKGTDTTDKVDLYENTNYKIEYQKNVKVGTGSVVITGINGYTGVVKKTFKIKAFKLSDDVERITAQLSEDSIAYSKGGAKPKAIVKFVKSDGTYQTLVEKVDYTLSYKNNSVVNDQSNPSKLPTVKITLKGNYSGTITKYFSVVPKDISLTNVKVADKVYLDKKGAYISSVKVYDTDGKALVVKKDYSSIISYALEDGTMLDSASKVDADSVIVVTIKAKEGSNYTGTVTGKYRVAQASITKPKVSIKAQIYTGKAIELGEDDITIKPSLLSEPLVMGVDYEIVPGSYVNNIKKGTASVVIRGKKNYCGTRKVNFIIKQKVFKWWWK